MSNSLVLKGSADRGSLDNSNIYLIYKLIIYWSLYHKWPLYEAIYRPISNSFGMHGTDPFYVKLCTSILLSVIYYHVVSLKFECGHVAYVSRYYL